MVRASKSNFGVIRRCDNGNLIAISGDDDPIGDANLHYALPHSDDEREATEKTEGFAGETRGAQSGWDNSERPHSWRSAGVARTSAKITSSNVVRMGEACKPPSRLSGRA